MSLKKYDELTDEQKKLVSVMYSDRDTVQNYLYNFDGEKYIGRQFYIKPDVKDNMPIGTVHAEPLIDDEPKEEVIGKTEPVKKQSRKPKK